MMCSIVKLYSLVRLPAASYVHGNKAEERCVGGIHVARDKRRYTCKFVEDQSIQLVMCLVVKLYSLVRLQAASSVRGNKAEERRVGVMHIARDKRRYDVSFYNSTASTWTLETPRTTWEVCIYIFKDQSIQ